MFAAKKKSAQSEFWIAADQVVTSARSGFYAKLEETLESFGFAAQVRAVCAPAYDKSGVGRPGIDPVVYLKMIMVGFFEDLPSERAIAARCADSMSIRAFLKYELDEKTPDHSSFTVIRQRLGREVYQRIFILTLQALREHGLLRGKNLGIDSSVIEANASLRALVHRNTEEQYWDYVKRLAAESGIDPDDTAAVRKFDRHRPGKGSNQEWENPHDPDAKIGRTKDGATDMIYKPEAVVDLDTGAIVQAQVHPGDQADHKEMATRVLEAQQNINLASGAELDTLTLKSVTSDKGYYAVGELKALQRENIRTVIADPINNRRLDRLEADQKQTVRAARRSAKSQSGKDLLRRRGMHIERSFAHILDCGGMRRTTLRGWENLNKRFKLAAAFYNLSQLMRKLFGFGTPKQLEALRGALFSWLHCLLLLTAAVLDRAMVQARIWILDLASNSLWPVCVTDSETGGSSTDSYEYGEYHGPYTRNADAVMKLQTGGKGQPQRENLWQLHAEAMQQFLWDRGATLPSITGSNQPIAATNIQILGSPLGSDGNLWRVLPDNTEVDVTPKVSGVDYFTFDVSTQEYLSHFEVFIRQPFPDYPHDVPIDGQLPGYPGYDITTKSAGHAWWQLDNDAPIDVLNQFTTPDCSQWVNQQVGYGPVTTTFISWIPPVKQGPGQLENDSGVGYNVHRTYAIGFQGPGLIDALNYTQSISNSPGTWNSDTNNCVHKVVSAGNTAGKQLPTAHESPEFFGFDLPPDDP